METDNPYAAPQTDSLSLKTSSVIPGLGTGIIASLAIFLAYTAYQVTGFNWYWLLLVIAYLLLTILSFCLLRRLWRIHTHA